MFWKFKSTPHIFNQRRRFRSLSHDLNPRLMRDIGIESWPEHPPLPTRPRIW